MISPSDNIRSVHMTVNRHLLPVRWRAYLRHPRVRGSFVSLFWAVVLFYFVFCSLILVTRWYLLPQVDRFKDDIASMVSTSIGSDVRIGAISPRWDTFWPRLELSDVRIYKEDQRTNTTDVLVLPHVSASFYWRTIFGQPLFKHLTVSGAELTVRRLTQTQYDVAGFAFDLGTASEKGSHQDQSDKAFLSWLLKQGRIDIVDSRVRYMDLTPANSLQTAVKDIHLTFADQLTHYAFGFQGIIDDGTNNTLDVRAEFTTSVLDHDNWRKFSGRAYAAASRINFGQLVELATPISDVIESGQGSARAWLDFSDGKIQQLTSDVFLRDVTLQLAKRVAPLSYKRLSAHLTETWDKNAIRIDVKNLKSRDAQGNPLPVVNLAAEFNLDETSKQTTSGKFSISEVDLGVLRTTLDSVPLPPHIADWIRTRSPQGGLFDVSLDWTGALMHPDDWTIRGRFEGITINAQEKSAHLVMVPGVRNLSGDLTVGPHSGKVALKSQKSSITVPDIFAVPEMHLDNLTGAVSWEISGDRPASVHFENLLLENADAAATAQGSWTATGKAGTIHLTGKVLRARAEEVWKYMPRVVGTGTQNWLKAGLVSGRARDGRFEIIGPLNQFPWADSRDSKKAHFLVDLGLTDAAIDYVPSYVRRADGSYERGATWPLLTDINGRLVFEGPAMRVYADSAKTEGVELGKTTAEIPNLRAKENTVLRVDGSVLADLQTMFTYLEKSPIGGYIGNAFDGTQATGQAELGLHLEIPLLHAKDTLVAGKVLLQNNDITMPHPIPPVTQAKGLVEFTQKGAHARGVTAKAFGSGSATANVSTSDDGTITIGVSGLSDVKHLSYFAPNPTFEEVLTHLKGEIPFVTTVSIQKGKGVTVVAQSNLKGLTSDLPHPLRKSAQALWPTSLSVTPVAIGSDKGHLISVDAGKRFDVMMQFPTSGSRLPTAGAVAVGTSAVLPTSDFTISVVSPKMNLYEWNPNLKRLIRSAQTQDGVTGKNTPSQQSATLSNISAKIDELTTSGQVLKAFELGIDHSAKDTWKIDLNSDKLAGGILYDANGIGSVDLDLERVHVSKKTTEILQRFLEKDEGLSSPQNASRQLPSIRGTIQSLIYDDMILGTVDIDTQATNVGNQEKIDIKKLTVTSPAAQLSATGTWTHRLTSKSEKDGITNLSVALNLKDTGDLLAQLGYPGVIQDAHGWANAELSYHGNPWSPKLETLRGNTSMSLNKGSFEQIETGPGMALLSLMSFQSLFKRLTLDFSDLTQKGLSFDTFVGTSQIEKGISRTDNTKIVTQHGTLLISGDNDFNRRNIDCRAVILPEINAGNASLALSFLNPAVGIGTFLAQLVLREPLSRLFKVEYDIKGPWDNPTIEKVSDSSKPSSKTITNP